MRNRKLFSAWMIFLIAAVSFAVGVEVYSGFKKERSSNYRYRIPIDKNERPEQFAEKKEEPIPKKKAEEDRHDDFYERTAYGCLPKISRDGGCVFDRYSACSEIVSGRKLGVAVLLGEADAGNPSAVDAGLKGQRVTFIVPHYFDRLEETVQAVRKGGHEFFIEMPLQFPGSSIGKGTIAPFLVNAEARDTLDKLFRLLASTKYALGIANVSPTLLTKSVKDMTIIAEALADRGVAFFNFEGSNDLLERVAEMTGVIHLKASAVFESDDFDISKLRDGDILLIRREHLPALMKSLPSDWVLTSVSACAGR
jgi:hypothetical protein